MSRVCQASCGVFAISVAFSLGASVVAAVEPTPHAAPVGVPVHLAAWAARPFAETVLADPDLASCFLISPGWWNTAAPPPSLPDETAFAKTLSGQLQGLVDTGALPRIEVVVAASEGTTISALAHGESVLVLVPKTEPAGVHDIARAAAQAILVASLRPAPPDPRCGEPLLMFGQAIATAGSLYLAALPPQLRPVSDWLEAKDAALPLAGLAADAFDPDTRWASRRARLARMSQVDGSNPQLAAAAALVVEAYGDPVGARRQPLDLLLAWKKGSGKAYPRVPREVSKALEEPLEAGLPKAKDASGRAEVERDAFARRIAAGGVPLTEIPPSAPLATRLLAAARQRASGGPGLCEWLKAGELPAVRTGCRAESEGGGVAFARPTASGSQVVAVSPTGEEGVLLVWPGWVLFPAVVPSTGELWFVDAKGVWRLPLDAHAAPRLAAPGPFRYLAVSPDGNTVATARWPSGDVLLIGASGNRELPVNGRGGIAWLESDVLAGSDGTKLTLASSQGKTQPDVATLPCCHSLLASRGAVVGASGKPCEPGLVKVALADRIAKPILKLAEGPVGLVQVPGGALLFGGPDGVSRWSGEGQQPERVADGLTPGPG